MIYLLAFQWAIFCAYIVTMVESFGVLGSISQSWYELKGGRSDESYLFTLFMWAMGIPLCFYGSAWFFFAGACLCFCGAAASYKEKMTGTVHGIGAMGGIGFAAIGLLLQGVVFPLIGIIVVATILKSFKVNNATWWIEIASVIFLILGFYTLLI